MNNVFLVAIQKVKIVNAKTGEIAPVGGATYAKMVFDTREAAQEYATLRHSKKPHLVYEAVEFGYLSAEKSEEPASESEEKPAV